MIAKAKFTISPNPFSPDNDGFEDYTFINYQLSQPVSQIRLRIFDSRGRHVRTIANHQAVGSKGTITFDGLDKSGNPLKIGIYIILFEAVNDRNKTTDIIKEVVVIARKLYKIYQDKGYNVTFIGGGARGPQHFSEMVGGDVCITINWSGTADKLLEMNQPVMERLFNPVPQYVIDELNEKLPDFKRGYEEDGIQAKEYEEFGPVVKFRNSFVKNWNREEI